MRAFFLGAASAMFICANAAAAPAPTASAKTAKAEQAAATEADHAGHFHEAVSAYEHFVADAPASMASDVEAARKRIDEIRALPATVKIATTPAGAALSIDGAAQDQATPTDVQLAPGSHVLRLAAAGYEAFEREIEVSYASTKIVNLDLVAAPSPAPSPAAPAPMVTPAPSAPPVDAAPIAAPRDDTFFTRRNVGLVAAGLAVVSVGFGGGFGIAALDNKASFDRHPTISTGNDGNDFAVASDIAFGAAAVLGITSAILLFTHPDDAGTASSSSASARTWTAAPLLTPHAAGASALIRF